MSRCLAIAAIAALMCASSAYAAEDAQNAPAGGTDTSTGAKEQSSAPAQAEKDKASGSSAGASSDTSTGAKEQSSAPEGSSAADKSQPNPTTGAQDLSKVTTQADCEKVGGKWDVHTNGCGEGSAKMGKEEGTHQGANLGTTPDQDTQKVEQPDRSDPATNN